MIVLIEPSGNHSNRLFQHIHFEAFCMEYRLDFANPTFEDMRHLYNAPLPAVGSVGPLPSPFEKKVKYYLSKLHIPSNLYSFDQEHPDHYRQLLKCKHICYVRGWGFRVHDLTAKYQDIFIKKYALKAEYYRHNEFCRQIANIDREKNRVIGIHVRRGDYKGFMGGKYYFTDDTYRLYMDNFRSALKSQDDKNNIFILFSNEDITIEADDLTLKSRNEWYVDQYLMSQCDYLIGPPSTFTMWASYIGKTKYFHMLDDSGAISMDKFTYAIG